MQRESRSVGAGTADRGELGRTLWDFALWTEYLLYLLFSPMKPLDVTSMASKA